jgi:hypothetical protein
MGSLIERWREICAKFIYGDFTQGLLFAAAASDQQAGRCRGNSVLALRRGYSVPERLTLAGAGAAAIGRVYPFLMAHDGNHGLPCPLRTITGVPCPFCGLTTATVALTHGEWASAAAASPLACGLAGLVAATSPVLAARALGRVPQPRPWSAAARRRTGWAVAFLLALSWLFQLHRFGYL